MLIFISNECGSTPRFLDPHQLVHPVPGEWDLIAYGICFSWKSFRSCQWVICFNFRLYVSLVIQLVGGQPGGRPCSLSSHINY